MMNQENIQYLKTEINQQFAISMRNYCFPGFGESHFLTHPSLLPLVSKFVDEYETINWRFIIEDTGGILRITCKGLIEPLTI